VIAYSVTARTSAQKQPINDSTAARRTSVACKAMFASFAAIPSPLVARLDSTMLGYATAM